MEAIGANFEKAPAEERQRLAGESAQSKSSGRILLAVDVAGIGLILILDDHPDAPDPPLQPRTRGLAERDQGDQRVA